jgi:hypothetical protein
MSPQAIANDSTTHPLAVGVEVGPFCSDSNGIILKL